MKSFKEFTEALAKDADAGDYIKDFEKSDAPQFKGKSKEKKRQMAIAAYMSNKNEAVADDNRFETPEKIKRKRRATMEEGAAANSVSGGGVDMNPTGKKLRDKRNKWDPDQIYRRAKGV